jgi:hypothetical protein
LSYVMKGLLPFGLIVKSCDIQLIITLQVAD